MSYAVIATTEYYGPEIKRALVSVHESEAEAMQAAEAYVSPDYDESVGCNRLAHNQASATRAEVAEIVAEGQDLMDDWTRLPDAVEDALIAALGDDEPDSHDDRVCKALQESNYAHVADADDWRIEYLVKI